MTLLNNEQTAHSRKAAWSQVRRWVTVSGHGPFRWAAKAAEFHSCHIIGVDVTAAWKKTENRQCRPAEGGKGSERK